MAGSTFLDHLRSVPNDTATIAREGLTTFGSDAWTSEEQEQVKKLVLRQWTDAGWKPRWTSGPGGSARAFYKEIEGLLVKGCWVEWPVTIDEWFYGEEA